MSHDFKDGLRDKWSIAAVLKSMALGPQIDAFHRCMAVGLHTRGNTGYDNLGWRDKRWSYLDQLILRTFRDFDI